MVTGLHPVYGLDGKFCQAEKKVSAKYAIYSIAEPGIYQGPKRGKGQMVAGSRRIDTGLVRIDAGGTVTEITLDEAKAAFTAGNPASN